jgi:hypothetical protein
MFEGSGFTIPALFVAVITVLLGGLCALITWVIVLLDQTRDPQIKTPSGLNTFMLSVVVELAGLLVLWHIPYDIAQRPILGTRMVLVIWSPFLVVSFVLCVVSWLFVRRDSGPGRQTLRRGSMLLLTIWMLGFVWYLVGD